MQLISVISLLSADVPDLNSPANVDAAKEVRENFPGKFMCFQPSAELISSVQEKGEAPSKAVCRGSVRVTSYYQDHSGILACL
jgi:hypothetical protein